MRYLFFAVIFLLNSNCNSVNKKTGLLQFKRDSALVMSYIKNGDRIYAEKANYSNFSKSLELYDTAWQIASRSNDLNLLAQAVFAKGRAYDAINNNPQKTIDYYTEAAGLYAKIPHNDVKALYIKHLVAHSYDKVQDSANCIKILHELFNEIVNKPDGIKKELRFTVEMALISTVIKNYAIADSILQQLTQRQWVKNDPTEYDYLNHYYLAKAKINVLHYANYKTLYLDSLENVFKKSANLNDSIYYSNELWQLYKAMGNSAKESYYLQLNNTLFNKFNSPESVRETKDKLTKMEVAAVEAQRKAENEKAEARKRFIYVLAGLLAVITMLVLFLIRRNREIKRKKDEVVTINQELHQKNLQNELLNKEIHHRVKNNLQMILSLVYMQERNAEAEETKENLHEIRLRIESIAALHRQLMEQGDLIHLRNYVSQMISSVANLVGNGTHVLTHLEIDNFKLPIKLSFPLGLILNEWVTNSMKYAQTEKDMLEIYLQAKEEGNSYSIQYRDSGKQDMKRPVQEGLGLNIIKLLFSQMNAVLTQDERHSFNYTLIIPKPDGE